MQKTRPAHEQRNHQARKLSTARTTKSYQKVVAAFSFISALLVGFILYFSFAKTTITITPSPVEQTAVFTVRIEKELPQTPADIPVIVGTLLNTTLDGSLTYTNITPSGKVDDIARGTVTIYNKWSQVQPLQATTRLLSSTGVLFHIEKRVDVPPGGKVEGVTVYADKPGPAGNIAASHFTIPGLWAGLQDSIYAESASPMTGGTRDAKLITENDLQAIRKQLSDQMAQDALKKLKEVADEQHITFVGSLNALIGREVQEEKFSAKVGDEADALTLDQKVRYIGLAIDPSALREAADAVLKKNLSPDLKLASVKDKDISYTVITYTLAQGSAELKVTAHGNASIRLSDPIFDRSKLLAKDEQEVRTYFSNYDQVKSVDVHFSPFWIKRTPSIMDHIEIKIAE